MSGGFSADDLQDQIPRLRRYARALTGSREAADDLTQDTLEHAWRKRGLWQPQPGATLRAWLFTVMHNRFVNSLRDSAAAVREAAGNDAPDVPGPAGDAEGRVVVGELTRALQALPADQREVVLLVGLEQLSYAETADVLGVPIGTVMSRLSRGREALRRLLDAGAGTQRPPLTRIK